PQKKIQATARPTRNATAPASRATDSSDSAFSAGCRSTRRIEVDGCVLRAGAVLVGAVIGASLPRPQAAAVGIRMPAGSLGVTPRLRRSSGMPGARHPLGSNVGGAQE